jgi:hypothetical protein
MKMEDGMTCGGIFNCDFTNQTASFANFRYMDLLNTNYAWDGVSINPVSDWSDRTWPTEGSRAGTNGGVAYEDIIALTNYTGKSAWINIPAQVTDDYVCRLARLLAYGEQGDKLNQHCNPTAPANGTTAPIRSDVTIYIEQTNEPWNWNFPITQQLYCWANGIGSDGTLQSCPTGNVTPPSTYVMQQLSTRPWRNGFQDDQFGKQAALQFLFTYRNMQIFRQVFTAAGRPNQVQIVLNTQSFNGGFNQYYLQNFWMPVYREMPADVMAFAPYLSPVCQNDKSCSRQDTTVGMIYDDISMIHSDPMNGMAAEMMNDLQVAQSVNMAPAAYEGSVSWQQDDVNLEIAATNDPRMKIWTTTYLQLWTQIMGPKALFNYFSLYSAWSQFGNWGAKANQADACSQRWSALMELTGGTDCVPSASAIPGSSLQRRRRTD